MEPKTVSVPEAGKWLGIGRNAATKQQGEGTFPQSRSVDCSECLWRPWSGN